MQLLKFENIVRGKLVRRYKRFLADIIFDKNTDETPVTVHCPNTGPMTGLLDQPLVPALCSVHTGTSRKYIHSLEALQPTPGSAWVGVHSAIANKIAQRALESGLLRDQIGSFEGLQAEVCFGADNKSRVDFVLKRPNEGGSVYVEVKSVTLSEPHALIPGANIALFPDTVSERAQKHVTELIRMKQAGEEAAFVFVVQRGDCSHFAPSWKCDPLYSRLLCEAAEIGVKMIVMLCQIEPLDNGSAQVLFMGSGTLDLEYKRPPPGEEEVDLTPKKSKRKKTK